MLDRAVVGGPTDRVQRFDEVTAVVGRVQFVQHVGAHPGHDPHRAHHVRRVGELHADFRIRRVQRPHAERYHVHGAAGHATRKPIGDRTVCVLQRHPVAHLTFDSVPGHVDRVPPVGRAYERPTLYPSHVPGTAASQKAVEKCRKVASSIYRTIRREIGGRGGSSFNYYHRICGREQQGRLQPFPPPWEL